MTKITTGDQGKEKSGYPAHVNKFWVPFIFAHYKDTTNVFH